MKLKAPTPLTHPLSAIKSITPRKNKATGGAAFIRQSANGTSIAGVPCGTLGAFPNCSASEWRPGISAGLGVEWGFAQNWTAKLEYLYINAVGSGVSTDHLDTVRGGINYRF